MDSLETEWEFFLEEVKIPKDHEKTIARISKMIENHGAIVALFREYEDLAIDFRNISYRSDDLLKV